MLLEMEHITITAGQKNILKNFFLNIKEKELVALVGASGSGKSILAHSIIGITPESVICSGVIKYKGNILTEEIKSKLLGNEIVLIPQNTSYLDPLMKVGMQVAKGKKDKKHLQKVKELFQKYNMEHSVINQYPFMLSGGMIRRVFICSALMETPKLVIADEPTPGLHKEMAQKVVSHFREIADMGAGVLMITHDLELAISTADKIIVLYNGEIMEVTKAENFKSEHTLYHYYTKALWKAMPKNGFQNITIYQTNEKGCPFAQYCKKSKKQCITYEIPYFKKEESIIKCLFAGGEKQCY